MLVLTRKVDQRVFIDHAGERLELMVTRIDGTQVKLGFEGPDGFVICRDDAIFTERLTSEDTPELDAVRDGAIGTSQATTTR